MQKYTAFYVVALYLICQFGVFQFSSKKRYVKNMDKWVFDYLIENIVGKGEIALYEQFLLFIQCFQTLSSVDASKGVSVE